MGHEDQFPRRRLNARCRFQLRDLCRDAGQRAPAPSWLYLPSRNLRLEAALQDSGLRDDDARRRLWVRLLSRRMQNPV